MVGGTIALSGVNIELDGNAAEGVLTFATDGRQTLQGTLAAEELDLTPYISTVRLLTSNERDWDRKPIALDGLNGIDLDLRLSAARVTIGTRQARPHRGRRQSARRQAQPSRSAKSQAFGGVVKGSFGCRGVRHPAPTSSRSCSSPTSISSSCLGEMFGFRRLEGKRQPRLRARQLRRQRLRTDPDA